ncbi:MAG: integrase core domain-containing protein [Candidatus Eisenbacteria bacterium]|nr:integrase core domain-containing protein [Candidatus Eisenbacteria bacterium]MBU1947607.1 integrase core domain-containing protein [Candidatus Eisenbacteria bacterium]
MRRIVHVNATTNPTGFRVKQKLREDTSWDMTPRFLVHDNDGIFGQNERKVIVEQCGRRCSYHCHRDRWLHEIMDIKGLSIRYGVPNASPQSEHFNKTLREEALNHFVFLGVDHIRRVVSEYVRYYNHLRPSQAIHGIPDPYPELKQPPSSTGKLVAHPVLGGVKHDLRLVA